MRKLFAAAVLVLTAIGAATAPAAAGGWAVVSLDPMPTAPQPGQPFEVGFTIRQHGRTPVDDPDAAIVFTDGTGHATRFAARPDGAVGHHVATVILPAPGTFHWSVEHFLGTQDLGTVTTRELTSTAGSGGGSTSPWTVALFNVAALLGALGVADLVRATRRRPRPA